MDKMRESSPKTIDLIIERESVRRIEQNACILPEPYRAVFHLRIYGNLTFEQIGKVYGNSPGWARVTYFRARKMIQAKIEEEK